MRILICCLIVFSNCRLISHISQQFCDIEKIRQEIKYFSLIQFLKQQYDNDVEEYQTYFQQQQKAFDDTASQRRRLMNQYQEIWVQIKIQEIQENLNPHDSGVEKAYKQLLEIFNFLNIFKEAQELLSFQLIFKQGNYQDDVFDQFLGLYESQSVSRKISNLKFQYSRCTKSQFKDEIIQFLSQDQDQYEDQHRHFPIRHPRNSMNQLQFSSSQVVNLKDFETKIELQDCPSKTPKIQSLYLEFQKLFQISEFRTNYNSEQIKAFQLFFQKNDQVRQDQLDCQNKIILNQQKHNDHGLLIKNNKLLIYDKLRKLLYDKQVIEAFEKQMQMNEYRFRKQQKPIYQFISLLIYEEFQKFQLAKDHAKKFFMLDQKYFSNLQKIFESLMQFIKNFNYAKDYISQGIQYFERDLKICQSQNEIYNEGGQQNSVEQQKNKRQNQVEQCQQNLQNIEQQFYQYQQALEMNRFIQYIQDYDKIFLDLSNNNGMFDAIRHLKYWQKLFNSEERIYFVEIYPTHYDPEDKVSVEAYENLLKLQNLIVFLFNAFIKAEELLDFDYRDIQSYRDQYIDLKKTYQTDIYPQDKVKKQLEDVHKNYLQCSNRQQPPGSYPINGQDYLFVKKLYPFIHQNLLIVPILVEEFQIEDISNYRKSSEQCKANIEGIVEDTLETLKIIELLKYGQAGQSQYNKMINLIEKKEFIEQVQKLYFQMEKISLAHKLKYFKVTENQNIDEQLQTQFYKLHSFNDNLRFFADAFYSLIDLLNFNDEDFEEVQKNQRFVDDYLVYYREKYQLEEMQDQLEELYHQYKVCTGYDFLYDFCRFYENQNKNIKGGICQQNCLYQPNQMNIIQQDIKIEKKKKLKNNQKPQKQKKIHLQSKQRKEK